MTGVERVKTFFIPLGSGAIVVYAGSRIIARGLLTISIVAPFDILIAYVLVTIAWFVLLDQAPPSRTIYFFCKGCMFGSVSPFSTLGALAFVGVPARDVSFIWVATVLMVVGLGIGHILGRILISAAVERAHFNAIRWRGYLW